MTPHARFNLPPEDAKPGRSIRYALFTIDLSSPDESPKDTRLTAVTSGHSVYTWDTNAPHSPTTTR
jgi:hypothetical protein